MIAPEEVRRHCPVEKSHSRKFVCCCLSGKLWDLQSVVLMNCKFSSYLNLLIVTMLTLKKSDVYMDHINRKMAIDMLVSATSPSYGIFADCSRWLPPEDLSDDSSF